MRGTESQGTIIHTVYVPRDSLEVHAAVLERHFVGRVAPVAEDWAPDA